MNTLTARTNPPPANAADKAVDNAAKTAPPAAQPAVQPAPHSRTLGTLLIIDALLSFAPLAIMAPAIGWPASLGNPAAQQLGAIAAAPGAVMAGYGLYLLYSILIAPVMIGLASRLPGGLASPAGASVAAFAALSALARSIGILRWLTVMPALAGLSLPVFGLAVRVPVAAAVSLLSVWMLAAGVVVLWRKP